MTMSETVESLRERLAFLQGALAEAGKTEDALRAELANRAEMLSALELESVKPQEPEYETVNHPPHYNSGAIEHIEYVEDRGWAHGYTLGIVTKHLHRAGLKPGMSTLDDLKKAAWYLNRYISWLEQGRKIARRPGTIRKGL